MVKRTESKSKKRAFLVTILLCVLIFTTFFIYIESHGSSNSVIQWIVNFDNMLSRQVSFYEDNYNCRFKNQDISPLPQANLKENTWYHDQHIIAHALGEIDGKHYTNSAEAFLQSIENGFILFEADIFFTTDGVPMLYHDRFERSIVDELNSGEVYASWFNDNIDPDGLTDMTLDTFLEYMTQYPDIYLITDAKNYLIDTTQSEYNLRLAQYIYDWAEQNNQFEIIDRIIIQIYSKVCIERIEAIPASFNYIFTLYLFYDQATVDHFDIALFCLENNITAVVMPYEWATLCVTEIYHHCGLPVYVHAVNDEMLARNQYIIGVHGIFSSFITPEENQKIYDKYAIR